MGRAWAFAHSVILRDPQGVRTRDEHFRLMLVDAERKGVVLPDDDERLILAVWQRAWFEAFEEGRLAERRDG